MMDAAGSTRILVVDDEASVLETIAAILSREGYEVVAVGCAADAIDQLRSKPFDVVLTDLRLEGASGMTVVSELHRTWPQATAIVLTGYASLQSAVDALREGVYDYLIKPCDVEELKATVARAIERGVMARQLRERLEELDSANAKLRSFNEELWRRVEQATAELNGKVRELAEAKRRLEEAQHQREEFIAMIAHELGQPLTMIGGYAQLLGRESVATETQERARNAIVSQTRRLARLVRDLSDATGLAAGRFRIFPVDFDLCEVVKEQVDLAQASVETHTIRLDVPDESIATYGDRDRIAQVLSNLLSNAVKYTPGGDIRIAVTLNGQQMVIQVQDSGSGIPRDRLETIFDPHVRLASQENGERAGGSGLGLYIARGIVEAHGGRIWAESQEGQGATFFIALPLRPTDSVIDAPQ